MNHIGECGNEHCANGCCCYCRAAKVDEHCPWCSTHPYKCEIGPYFKGRRNSYVCWNCRNVTIQTPLDSIPYTGWIDREPNCGECKNIMIRIRYFIIRFPKKNDKKGWELLQKVLEYDFSKFKEGSRGRVMEGINIFPRIHLPESERNQFWVPMHNREFDSWLEDMKKPFIPHPNLDFPTNYSGRRKLGFSKETN